MNEQLDSLLHAWRCASDEMPPASIEGALRAEIRVQSRRRRHRRLWWSASVFSVAAALILLTSAPRPKPMPGQHTAEPPRIPARAMSPPDTVVSVNAVRKRSRSHAHGLSRAPRFPEHDSGFMAIPYTEPLSATERLDIYRVQVPRAVVAQFGLPMNADGFDSIATADVVVGDDGVARAIRFVR